MNWTAVALVAAGSALGGVARFWLGMRITAAAGPAFPWGTFAINALGSLAIGYASGWSHVSAVRHLVMIGLCGGFTTFSSFSLENLTLLRQGEFSRAALYAAGSMMVCLCAVWLGFLLARWQQE